MKKISKIIPATPEFTTFLYESNDGKTFTSEERAKEHDAELYRDSIRNTIQEIEFSDMRWLHLKTDEQLIYFKFIADIGKCYTTVYGEIKLPGWVSLRYIDGGDRHDEYEVYTLEYVKEEFQNFLRAIAKAESK